ncbi:purine-nucleoside phosphorylase [Youxingia wuxianensis]|uniref:Purine nucleoside phosphorylase DeoD-type n=1 Tax=Youxingia wuxianensis TaxID=2763678 RepID=A0A926EQU0_9FIRM|nr:purine-nucleoside phosphorylase [Youxingia wuxianensis]MBC8584605.1 purine-nucleoside phosphorylase [Youxingia wuxianensis]
MATPHNAAQKGDFAKTVFMPGDPLRAKLIAETYFQNSRLVNPVRGIGGYTGTYQGKPVSVMASGMGCPSIGIYSYELFTQYDVENIIRIGTAGAIHPDLKIGDLVLGQGACTDSNFLQQYRLPGTYAPIASYALLEKAVALAKEKNVSYKVGNLFTSDKFYDAANSMKDWQKMGVLAVEMEAAALYATAAFTGKNALAVCTISDCPLTGEASDAQYRETQLHTMIKLALELA